MRIFKCLNPFKNVKSCLSFSPLKGPSQIVYFVDSKKLGKIETYIYLSVGGKENSIV